MNNLFLTRQPGRYVRNCIVAAVDPCDSLTQADWNQVAWISSGGGFAGVYVLPNLIDGLIASVDSYPAGGYYNTAGLLLGALTYSVGLGYYTTPSEIVPQTGDYVLIPSVPVTLNDGSSCTLNFRQYLNNTIELPDPPTDEFTLTTNVGGAIAFTLYTSVGTIDWGDGTVDAYDASGGSDSPSTTLAAGTFEIKAFNGNDTTRIDAQAKDLLSVDLQRANQWTDIDFSNNTNLITIIWPAVHTVVTTSIDLDACGFTSLNLSSISRKGGEIKIDSCPNLTFINYGSSADLISNLRGINNDLTGTINISGLTLDGKVEFDGNPNLENVIFGTQTGVFTKIDISSSGLLTLDLSGCTNMGGELILDTNTSFASISLPTSSQVFSNFKVNSAAFVSLDVSGLTALAGDFQAQNIAELTTFTGATSSGVFNRFYIFSADITGTLDLSGFSGLGGNVRWYSSSSLTAFTAPTSSEVFTFFYGYSCALTTLDLSTLTGLGGDIRINLNSGLTTLTLPTSSTTTTVLRVQSCDLSYFDLTGMTLSSALDFIGDNNTWTTTETNHMLVDLEATLPGTGTGTLTMAGDNSAPDGSSGGYDGDLAKSNIIAAGYTVSTN